MPFLYETHVHSSQCSLCGLSSSEEMVYTYHKAGYDGLVLTDHFIFGNTSVDRDLPWEERAACYYQAYLDAKKAAEGLDFDVIFGIEHAYGDGKEMLIYGVELDFLLANPDIPEITIDELVDRVHSVGGVVIQAHPYRDRYYVNMAVGPRDDIVDGVEVYNAGNLPGENVQALELTERMGGCIITSGGDVHCADDDNRVGKAGVLLPFRAHDSYEFAQALKRREHGWMVHGEPLQVITAEKLLGQ